MSNRPAAASPVLCVGASGTPRPLPLRHVTRDDAVTAGGKRIGGSGIGQQCCGRRSSRAVAAAAAVVCPVPVVCPFFLFSVKRPAGHETRTRSRHTGRPEAAAQIRGRPATGETGRRTGLLLLVLS